MPRREPSLRRRLLVVGAGFVSGGALIIGLAYLIGSTPVGEEVLWAGVIGGLFPVAIGLVLLIMGGLVRR